MPDQFIHGVNVVEIDDGPRTIETVRASVIGLTGTAPEADPEVFPIGQNVLIAGSRLKAAQLGAKGTLPAALDGIFDQTGAMVVVSRVEEGETEEETMSNIIGGVDPDTGNLTGVKAFLEAEDDVHLTPRILIAPGFTHQQAVVSEMLGIADKLRAVIIADGPNTTDEDAISYRGNFGSPRVYLVDPWVKVWDTVTDKEIIQPASARVAGLIAKSDNERGYWWSPSNREIYGINGAARKVPFRQGDVTARANYLNENEVTTIIRKDGFRLWGNRSCSADPKWKFLSVRRTADMINESLLQAHMWAVDRNINKTLVEDVLEGVENYMSYLRAVGAIINGSAWADPELNTPSRIANGELYIDFDFSANYPAEHITFQSRLTNKYLKEILPKAA